VRPGQTPFVPCAFDLSVLVRRSVATLYSHLVTRPTGRALRLGIESQLGELGAACLSVLDFTQVVVLDYSCADEAVAKLLQRFLQPDRPVEAYFVARGLGEQHRDPIETVLARHGLALVAQLPGRDYELLGHADALERAAWTALEEARAAPARVLAGRLGASEADALGALERLSARRVVLRRDDTGAYRALSALIAPA
jgi:hypothetical protein